MQNYVQQGSTVTIVAPYAVTSGGGVLVTGTGYMFGIAATTQSQGDSLEIAVQGVFDLAKDNSTFANGDYVYWDNTNKVATSTATGNKKIGVALLSQPSGVNAPGGNAGDATVRVRLNSAF